MTPEEHRAEAEKLLSKARSWNKAANNPDAAGSGIRERWRRQAEIWRQEALIHAQLGAVGQ